MKLKFNWMGMLLFSLVLIVLTGCSNKSDNSKQEEINKASTSEPIKKVEKSSEQQTKKETTLDLLNRLSTMSKSTEELYVTNEITIGTNQEIKPGIYDLEITGGTGNISGTRKSVPQLFINWVGGAKGSGDYPSKIRLILFEGDVLKMSNISKVKFNAVPLQVQPSNELGIGDFIVGRDIPAGNYKLSTNAKLNPKFNNLGWSTKIYNDSDGKTRDQALTAANSDIAVTLKEGEIISINYFNTDYGTSSDDAKLIFSKF